jgi:hypothetical protein
LALEPDRELTAHIVREASLLASEKDRRAAADRQELAALRSRDDQQQMVIDHLTEGVQQERLKWMTAAAAHDLARSEAVHLRSALQTLETARDCERREFQDRMAEAHRERQALIKGRDQLSDSLRLNANWLRLARIDVETVRANEGRQREQLLTMLSAGGREIHALMAECGQPSSQAEPSPRRSDEVPPTEVSLLEAVRISIRRISQAKGQRWREALVLAAAARARVRRQLRSLRNPRHQ